MRLPSAAAGRRCGGRALDRVMNFLENTLRDWKVRLEPMAARKPGQLNVTSLADASATPPTIGSSDASTAPLGASPRNSALSTTLKKGSIACGAAHAVLCEALRGPAHQRSSRATALPQHASYGCLCAVLCKSIQAQLKALPQHASDGGKRVAVRPHALARGQPSLLPPLLYSSSRHAARRRVLVGRFTALQRW